MSPLVSSSSANAAASKSSSNANSERASVAQNNGDTQEYAGNASTTSFEASTSQCSHSFRWCADTGATSHMTPHREWFEEYTPHSVPIKVANGTVVKSTGIGSVRFRPALQGSEVREVVFHRVLHVPALQNSLLSVLYLTRMQSFRVLIDKQSMQFERQGALLFIKGPR